MSQCLSWILRWIYDVNVINEDVTILITVVDDVWCVTYEPYWWNLCYFINCGFLYFTIWKKEKIKRNKYLHMSGNNKYASKLKRTKFDKTVHIAILGPIHFSRQKISSAIFFRLFVSSWWYAQNKNSRPFDQTHSAYIRTHTLSTEFQFHAVWCWSGT